MRRRYTQTNAAHVTRSFVTMRGLMLENARLSGICVEAQEAAARHAMLLREGNHRIKNSLQVLASVLAMQARREPNLAARDALHAANSRIQAVARVHDALQIDGGGDFIDIGALIASMSRSLHVMAGGAIMINVSAEPIQAPIALAQPIVLATCELILNALRHAFPGDCEGTVVVTVSQSDRQLRIVVADDGAGLPLKYRQGRGYGMTLVHAMVAKVSGRLEVNSETGTRFTLSAPLSLPSATPSHCVPDPAHMTGPC